MECELSEAIPGPLMKVVAVIPARSGSKGIPNKNLVNIGGKPLISWSIEAAMDSETIDKIIVTSDGDEILSISAKYDQVTLVNRPSELAQDNTPTAPVVMHALEELGIDENSFDFLVLLQPTSPLRTGKDIDSAFHSLTNSDASALISVVEPEHHPLKCFKTDAHGYLEGLVNNEYPFMPRQELPQVFQPNGAIYMIKITEFIKLQSFFTNKTKAYPMSAASSIDVDTYEDIKKIENQLKTNPSC